MSGRAGAWLTGLGAGASFGGVDAGTCVEVLDATGVDSGAGVEGGGDTAADVAAGGELEDAGAAAGDGGGVGGGGGEEEDEDGPTTKLMPGSRPPAVAVSE